MKTKQIQLIFKGNPFYVIQNQLKEINKYKEENERLINKIKKLEINNSQINEKNDDLRKKIDDLKQKTVNYENENTKLVDEIKQFNDFLNRKPDRFIKSFAELHQNEYCHFSYLLNKDSNGDKYFQNL